MKLTKYLDKSINGVQLYMVAFAIYFLPAFLMDSIYTNYFGWSGLRLMSYLSIPLLSFKIFVLDNFKLRTKIIMIIMMVLSVIIWRSSQYPEIFVTTTFVLASKDVPFRMIAKWYLYLSVTLLAIIIVTSLINVVPNLVYKSYLRPNRYGMGMAYTTFVASHVFFSILAYCYLKFRHLNWFDYLGIVFIATLVMKYTDTRLDYYASLLTIPLVAMAQIANQKPGMIRKLMSFVWMATPVTTLTTIIMAFFFSPHIKWMRKANEMLSGRLSLSEVAFRRYDVNLIGQKIHEKSFGGMKGHQFANHNLFGLSKDYFYIDSSVIRMLLVWGGIVFLSYTVVMTLIALLDTVNQSYILSVIILLVAINSMIEPHALQLIYNIFILSIGSLIRTINLNLERNS